jgi:hypothetical protein
MSKKTGFRLFCLAAMVFILFIAQAQTEEQGWKKTITLPSGEVVCDLNGEWDWVWTGRGPVVGAGSNRDVIKITQQGNSFKGIHMKGYQSALKGSVAIEGELDKNGFKKLIYTGVGTSNTFNGKISKDGNKIEFRSPNSFVVEMTRR